MYVYVQVLFVKYEDIFIFILYQCDFFRFSFRNWLAARQEAAIKVQAWFRGSRARRWYNRLRDGVTTFQAAARGYLLRKTLPDLRRRLLPSKTRTEVRILCFHRIKFDCLFVSVLDVWIETRWK